jgi:hypothetical protein
VRGIEIASIAASHVTTRTRNPARNLLADSSRAYGNPVVMSSQLTVCPSTHLQCAAAASSFLSRLPKDGSAVSNGP